MRADLPFVPLSKAVTFRGGGTPSKRNVTYWGGPIPWVSPKDMKSDLITSSQDTITKAAISGSAVKIIPKGATLVVVRSGILARTVPVAMAACELTVNQDLRALIPGTQLDSRYLNYFMRSAEPYLLSRVTRGATVHKIDSHVLTSLHVPLPPRVEQERTVAILNEAFAGIATAVANTEKNLANARELFDSYLNSVFSGRSGAWAHTVLGAAYDVRDGTHDSPKYFETGRALVTSKNLRNGSLDLTKVNYISEEDYSSISKRSGVDKGDVLFAMIGTIGNPVVVEDEPDFAIKNVALFKVGPQRSGRFLRYYLMSKDVLAKMMGESKGTTQKFVGLGYLRQFPIKLPDPAVEVSLVEEIAGIENETIHLSQVATRKLSALAELKQSILQKAFSGELTNKPPNEIETALA